MELRVRGAKNKMTRDEIRLSSTAKLRKILKEDIPVELDDEINYELYIRDCKNGTL